MSITFIDVETFSPVDLSKGLARYASQGEVMIVTWAVDEGPVQLWGVTAGTPVPQALLDAVQQADRLVFHNAAFDTTMLEGEDWWPKDVGHKTFCTMAMALRHGLPGGLDKLSHIFRLAPKFHKLPGKDFINLFCKLRKGETRATSKTHPKQWADGLIYAQQDIRAMREIYFLCPAWNDSQFELDLCALDQKINRRGIAVDVPFATAAVRACKAAQERNADKTQALTEATVLKATQRDRLLEFIFMEHGVTLPDLRADTVERRLEDPELPPMLKELLRVRLSSAKTSTSKYKRVLDLQFAGRMHWLLQYCAAIRTKRWGGRNFQPQNLMRPRPGTKLRDIEAYIEAVLSGHEDLLLGDDTQAALADAVRSVLIAGPGKKLVSADLSNIEGRFLPWIAGEEWELQVFRDYDRGVGQDLYKVTYGNAFDVDPSQVTDFQRQIGKVILLAFAIGGGVGACVTAAATYHIDLEVLAAAVHATAPKQVLLDAEEIYQWAKRKRRTLGLEQHVYVACEVLKRMWRDAHPATVQFWADCEKAAIAAICNPGQTYKAGKYIEFDKRGVWLRLKLPSGGYLSYPNVGLDAEGGGLTYMAWNVYKKGWHKERTWGSKLASDVRQGGARDCMAARMQPAEDAGYPIVLTVHDELVCETPESQEFTAAKLSSILATNEDWNVGLPLAADGHEMQRYHKR